MTEENFDFEKFNESFDDVAIAMEEMAKIVVPMYLGYRKASLSVQESAALTAAMLSQMMPFIPQKPQED